MKPFDIIGAIDSNNGIGVNDTIPWRLPSDMKRFKTVTTDVGANVAKINAVIMGRKTWESIPQAFRPLAKRLNVVLSRDPAYTVSDPGVITATSFTEALDRLSDNTLKVNKIFVAGGTELYTEAIAHPYCASIHVTRVHDTYECDAFFPPIDNTVFELQDSASEMLENNIKFSFETWRRAN